MESRIVEPTRVIDLAALFAGDPDPSLDEAIAQTLAADGSFVATGFPSPGAVDRHIEMLLGFFRLPEPARMATATRQFRGQNPNIYRGYYPGPGIRRRSRNEIFDIGPEPPVDSPDVPGAAAFREANVWPMPSPSSAWRDGMLELMAAQRDLALVLMGAIARGLGLRERAVVGPCEGRNATLRLLHYPQAMFSREGYDGAGDARIEDGRYLVGRPHVDTGVLSLLWQDAVGGLQMKGADGVWREVAQVPDGLSVHCGDLIAGLTGGRLQGTEHRVVGHGDDRCSVGFFLEPDFGTGIVPAPGRDPITYARHLVEQFPDRFDPARVA